MCIILDARGHHEVVLICPEAASTPLGVRCDLPEDHWTPRHASVGATSHQWHRMVVVDNQILTRKKMERPRANMGKLMTFANMVKHVSSDQRGTSLRWPCTFAEWFMSLSFSLAGDRYSRNLWLKSGLCSLEVCHNLLRLRAYSSLLGGQQTFAQILARN